MVPFFILTILLLPTQSKSQDKFTPELKSAMVLISEMRFDEASKMVDRSRLHSPENRINDYLDAASLCISLFLNEDQAELKKQQDQLEKYLARIEEMAESNPYRNLFLGELYVAQAILNGKFKNNLTAAWQFYKAYQYLTDNYKSHPDFAPNYIPLGVLYSAIGSLPEDYRRIASLLGFEGDVSEGLNLLRKAYVKLSNDPALDFYSNYAGFIYSYVSFQLDPSSNISPRTLNMNLTSSSFLLYLQARISYEQGKVKEAAHWLERRPVGNSYTAFHHLDYLHGKYLLGLEPEKAKTYLVKYLDESENELYHKSSYRYLSWMYLLEGDDQRAERMRMKVLVEGSTNTGADRQALLEAGREWNEPLVRARVLFDAALYNEAKQVLDETSVLVCCQDAEFKAEFYYRQGRILQKLEESDDAQKKFKQALSVKDVPDTYALGNSALQAGLIAENRGDLQGAKSYYKQALNYDQYPFYEGIHQKAKAGLNRIK